jgi:hypothetical protein
LGGFRLDLSGVAVSDPDRVLCAVESLLDTFVA